MNKTLIELMQATASPAPVAVETKEWGTVYVRAVLACDLEDQSDDDADDSSGHSALVRNIVRGVARIVCDPSGKLLFDADNKEHFDLLSKQPWGLLQQLTDAGAKLNGTTSAKNA